MRHIGNPPNPYVSTHCEPIEPAQSTGCTVFEERACSIITRNESPDVPYRWSVNPYRGCAHGCSYCYARRTHEYLDWGAGSDFECRLTVKINAAELLAKALAAPRWRHEQLAFSGVTDCYQPLEARYGLTRRCLEVCLAQNNPVGVVTKSTLIVRDADLLAEMARRVSVSVCLTITCADAALAARLEPGAPPPEGRFRAMQRLHAAGVPVGLLIAPVIPGLNDRDIPTLLRRAVACGATRASYAPIRLPGSVARVFLDRLRQDLPEAAARVEARIRAMRGGLLNNAAFGARMRGHGPYWESVERLFETFATRLGLDAGQSWRKRAPAPPVSRQLMLFQQPVTGCSAQL